MNETEMAKIDKLYMYMYISMHLYLYVYVSKYICTLLPINLIGNNWLLLVM